MIRLSEPEDTDAIARLCLAQYQRTPWPPDGAVASAMHVCEHRSGRVIGALAYRHDGGSLYVIHVWTEDSFAGRRAGVELMTDLEAMADAEGLELTFTVGRSNLGLQHAVEEHACMPQALGDAVYYRRKARIPA
jgi:GNAT superfamily N-acetyltransferase